MLLDSSAGPGCGVCGSWGGVGGFGADLVERRHRLGPPSRYLTASSVRPDDRDHHAAGDRPPPTAGHERAADQSHAVAEKDAADDDQQKTETSRHTHHLARRPDRPVVVPTMRADKTGTVNQVARRRSRSTSGGRLNMPGLSLTRSFRRKYRNPPTVTTPPAATEMPEY